MNTPSPYAVWHEIIRSHIRGMEIAANISRQAEEQALQYLKNDTPQPDQTKSCVTGTTCPETK
jgi:hypothetical protein